MEKTHSFADGPGHDAMQTGPPGGRASPSKGEFSA
jgi:hypothetical protein